MKMLRVRFKGEIRLKQVIELVVEDSVTLKSLGDAMEREVVANVVSKLEDPSWERRDLFLDVVATTIEMTDVIDGADYGPIGPVTR